MDDKACRLDILRIFKDFRDQQPNDYISRKDRFTKPLRIDENMLDRNVRYLADKGLVEVERIRGNRSDEGLAVLNFHG